MGTVWDNPKIRGFAFFVGGFLCLAAAAVLVLSFSGKWGDEKPKHVAGPALHFSMDDSADNVSDTASTETGENKKEEHWVLYITGAVKRPGVYRLPPGSRVYQLVDQAGGLTPEAVPEAFNMAAPLADGMHIHVPDKTEAAEPSPEKSFKTPYTFGSDSLAGGTVDNELIDINRADVKTLEKLPGIGPKTAEAIIRYRDQEGPFRCVEDLLSVKGIGPAKLEAIRDQVRVSR